MNIEVIHYGEDYGRIVTGDGVEYDVPLGLALYIGANQ